MKKDKVEKDLYDILGQDIDVPNSFSNSILNFNYKKTKRLKMDFYRKVAIAFSFLVVSMSMVGYAFRITDIFKSESSVGYVDNSIKQAVENGYIQNVDMDYLYSNNVGAKIDYVIMSDYNLNILFNFDVSMKENMQNTIAYIEDLLIYDENNNVIYCNDKKTYRRFCEKNDVKCDKDEPEQYANGFGWENIELNVNLNRTLYKFTAIEAFPKSEKLYIQFNTIYFNEEKSDKIEGRWNLELNLREKFYNRKPIEFELETESDYIELINANITDTVMSITYKIKEINNIKLNTVYMYVEDNLGNRYDPNSIENPICIFENEVSVKFPIINNKDFKKLRLCILINNKQYVSVVLKSKNK